MTDFLYNLFVVYFYLIFGVGAVIAFVLAFIGPWPHYTKTSRLRFHLISLLTAIALGPIALVADHSGYGLR